MSGISLYWHDYETFGVDPRQDFPAQFAGIRTDEELNPLADPLVIYCHPPLDRFPDPQACLVTGITPQLALQRGVCEARFAASIHEELSVPGTCGVGYNTIRFDDEVTRNLLYRNFFDPYEREWRNGNSRWDIIDMVRLTAALRPDGIEWPVDGEGRASFRLELLTEANGISHSGSHDALADVRATIELAKLIKGRQPRLYDFVWRNRGKREAADLLRLGAFEPVIHVSEKYPADRRCLAIIVALARHPVNHNEVVVYDLSADPADLLDLGAEAIRERLFTRSADLPEGARRVAIKTVHLNKCPVLVPVNTLRPADGERLGIDLGRCRRHLSLLKGADGLSQKLAAIFAKPVSENAEVDDPDLMIYRGGFFGHDDKSQFALLREMSPRELALVHPVFADPRLPQMLFRYRARNHPQTLDGKDQGRWDEFRRRRLAGKGYGNGLSAEEYQQRLTELEGRADCSPRDRQILAQLRDWGRILLA